MSSPPLSSLPAGHFLALAPTFTAGLASSSRTHPQSQARTPHVDNLASADYDVDVRTGFLPADPTLLELPVEYALWERLLEDAKAGAVTIGGVGEDKERATRWRRTIKEMPVLTLPARHLTAPVLRRTSVTLAFLLHFYVHSHPAPTGSISIPASISVPFAQVSALLGLPPICTYATTVLYNVIPQDPTRAFHLTQNPPVRCHATFTGTKSEDEFYLVSSKVELQGVKALGIMRATLDEAFVADEKALRRITGYLRNLAGAIDELTKIMKTMREGCDPAEFYWLIRPWFRGSDGDGPGGLGWLFEGTGADGHGERKIVSGPSAGQSSLVHSLDLFLGIDHSPRPSPHASPSSASSTSADAEAGPSRTTAKPSNEETFMQRMLQYMPGSHRQFLLHLQANSDSIRSLVLRNQEFDRGELASAYDLAVTAMGKFRDYHMVIVTMYIIQQARRPPPAHLFPHGLPSVAPPPSSARPSAVSSVVEPASSSWQTGSEKLPSSVASATADTPDEEEPIRGTGGTALAKFLKLCKARTVETRLHH